MNLLKSLLRHKADINAKDMVNEIFVTHKSGVEL